MKTFNEIKDGVKNGYHSTVAKAREMKNRAAANLLQSTQKNFKGTIQVLGASGICPSLPNQIEAKRSAYHNAAKAEEEETEVKQEVNDTGDTATDEAVENAETVPTTTNTEASVDDEEEDGPAMHFDEQCRLKETLEGMEESHGDLDVDSSNTKTE